MIHTNRRRVRHEPATVAITANGGGCEQLAPRVSMPVAMYRRASATALLPDLPRNTILVGDALDMLRSLLTGSIDTAITSPPYHLLRRYGAGTDEIGTEADVDEYVQRLVAVGDELARVLKPTGSWWMNLGDSYSRHDRYGAPPKSLLLAPERVLLALADHGWIVRNKVVWAKPNPTPHSVGDRLSCTWEPIFFLVRSHHYFFDLDAVRAPHRTRRTRRRTTAVEGPDQPPAWAGPLAGRNDGLARLNGQGIVGHPLGKNPGDVWHVPTGGFRSQHHAVYPPGLIELPIRATCPERVCAQCGQPWERERRRDRLGDLTPTCACRATWRPGVVLDPFIGSGTTAVVAEREHRDWLGIELNPEFAGIAEERIAAARDGPANQVA